MRWIVLALSLGASIMSIMHGILIILGIFNPPETAVWSSIIPPMVLKSLPIASASTALLGGVISFSSGRIGAFFLLAATALCAFAPRDIWIYGGLYFLAAILCLFLKKRQDESNYYDYDFEDFESLNTDDEDEYENNRNNKSRRSGSYEYEEEDVYGENRRRKLNANSRKYDNDNYEVERENIRERLRDSRDFRNSQDFQDYNESRNENRGTALNHANIAEMSDKNYKNDKNADNDMLESVGIIRRRTFKTCPKCGENVNPEARVCPTCGATLHVPEYALKTAEQGDAVKTQNSNLNNNNLEFSAQAQDKDNININSEKENINKNNTTEIKTESRDDDMQAVVQLGAAAPHKVFVKPRHDDLDIPRRPVNLDINPDKSYQEFGQYARRRKRGKNRSFGRRVFSFLLLFVVAGGALWFLLGLRKLPKDELPPLIRETTTTREEQKESEDVLVQPVGPAVVAPVNESANSNNNNTALPYFAPDRNPKQAIITRPSVNLREEHTTASRSLTKLAANTRAEILERWGGSGSGKTPGPWYKVRIGEREGWVYGDYVQQRGGSLPSGYSSALLKSFGNNKAALTANFGTPRSSNNTTIEWSGVTATFRNNNLVRLRLNPGSRYELKNGLKPGLSRDDLLNIMGYPSSISQRNYIYSENGKTGVSVEVRNNAVSSVTVNDVQ